MVVLYLASPWPAAHSAGLIALRLWTLDCNSDLEDIKASLGMGSFKRLVSACECCDAFACRSCTMV